jgi:LuxR family quorum sensing-dependent transcriptional regulator
LADRFPSSIQLTPRQLECLTRIAAGQTSAEIGAALGLSTRTVDHYVTHACARLGVRNRAQAVAKAIRTRLIPDRVR